MSNIVEALSYGVEFLKKHVSNPKLLAEILLCNILGIKKNDLFFKNNKISKSKFEKFKKVLKRRAANEPVEYIIGYVDFYDTKILVNKDVLIPRVETEILVDLISKKIEKKGSENKILFDVCTGSGAIGISLKKRFPNLKVIMSDISKKALRVAKKNAKINKVDVELINGHLLDPFKKKADYIVCNPPYVSKKEFEKLDKDVKDYEPKLALIAGENGLFFYKKFESDVKKYLNSKANLFFEIGSKQKKSILKIFSSNFWKNKIVIKDYSGKNRFFFVEIE